MHTVITVFILLSYAQQIMEVGLNCSKLAIFRDIMALEDSALAELTQCLDKIHAALRKYLDITTDVSSLYPILNDSSVMTRSA